MKKNRISVTLWVVLTSLSMLSIMSVLYPSYALASPHITFPETSFDFGQIYQNKVVNHIFTFKNTGDEVLNINEVKTSCGCTAAVLSSKTIKPGESGQIEITFNPAHRKDKQTKVVYVHSDDPDKPIAQLTIEALVKVDLEAVPSNVFFNQAKPDQAATQEVVLKNTGQETMSILSIDTAQSPAISAKLSSEKIKLPLSLKQNESLTIIISVKKAKDSSRMSGQMIIKTDSKTTPEVIIPVFVIAADAGATNQK